MVLALVFAAHALFFPWFPELKSANELSRVYLAESLIEDGTVSVDPSIARHGRIFDLSVREVDGKPVHYSDKAPGVALVSLPALAVYRLVASESPEESLATEVRLVRIFGATLPTLLLLVLLSRFLREELASPHLPAILVLAYGLGTVATPYASLAFGHQLSALLLFGLFLRIRKTSVESCAGHLVVTGLIAGASLLVEYQNAIILLPFMVWYLARVRLSPKAIGLAVLGALPPVLALMVYHQAAFGSPFLTGYSFIASNFAEVHAQGLLGIAWPKVGHAFLSFLSPQKGLFYFSPWLVLGALGLFRLEPRGDHRFHIVFVALYALFVSAMVYPVGGWTVSQRHLAPMVPFLLLPAGLLLERAMAREGRWSGVFVPALFVGLVAVSIAACFISAVVWPHYPEHLENPFWQMGWPLFIDGWVPPNALSLVSSWWLIVGLSSVAALILLTWLAVPWILRHRPGALVGTLGTVVLVVVAWVALSRIPGRDQDVERDRSFAERVYVADPRSNP
ncbi:MAG TPA: hypothetical protein PK095_01160 [Myxococcota bacterium]|nr:hypothetical protein [Myxococcota bacterium]